MSEGIELLREVLKTMKENEERLSVMLAQMRISLVVLEETIKKLESSNE